MNIIREPFLGGERYFCTDCGAKVEENFYPTPEVGTSAENLWLADKEQAEKKGIFFSGYNPCNC